MPCVFWTIVLATFIVGGFLSARWGTFVIGRVAHKCDHPDAVRRAGRIAGGVAGAPSLVIAIFIGGNLGGALATNVAARLSDNIFAQQAVMGLGVGIGGMLVLGVLIVTTMAAAATFMKLHLAGN